MTLDLTALSVGMETKLQVARFYVGMVEALVREGVEEWVAREEARHMAVTLLMYAIESDEGDKGPFPGL